MNEQELRQIIEEVDPEGKISQSVVEELVVALSVPPFSKTAEVGTTEGDLILLLQDKLKDEKDWRERARIAARIISINMDT